MDTTHVSYIYSIKDGFLTGNKFQKEIDISSIKPGDTVTTFYNEEVVFYSFDTLFVDDKLAVFEGDTLCFLTPEQVQEKSYELIQKFYNQLVSVASPSLKNETYPYDPILDSITKILTQSGVTLNNQSQTVFSLEEYQKTQNELLALTFRNFEKDSVHNINAIHNIVRVANTCLYEDNIINTMDTDFIFTKIDDETEERRVCYSRARRSLDGLKASSSIKFKK